MIKLAAGEMVLREADGTWTTCKLDSLVEDLNDACRAAGIDDPDLPRNLVEVVHGFVESRQEQGLSRREVEQLLVRIMGDCGLHELATRFCERRRLGASLLLGDLVRPDREAVRRLLADDSFFLGKETGELAAAVAQCLGVLDLPEVSPALVRELGKHLWMRQASRDTQQPDASEYWLLPRAALIALLSSEQARLMVLGQVQCRAVSRLLPLIDLDVNLPALRASLPGREIVLHLQLYPRFAELCDTVAAIARTLHAALAPRLDHAVSRLRIRITLAGLDDVAREAAPGRAAAVAAIATDLHDIAARSLRDLPDCELRFA